MTKAFNHAGFGLIISTVSITVMGRGLTKGRYKQAHSDKSQQKLGMAAGKDE
jgi:hypothetical protein